LRLTDPSERLIVKAVIEKAVEKRLEFNQDLAVRIIELLGESFSER
jgi:hypothetical protein